MHRWIPTCLLLATGCAKMAIDGQVTDVSGSPLPGASVTLVGTQCQAIAGSDGRFTLPCLPGVYEVMVAQSGYITETIPDFDASERKRYDLGQRALVRIPDHEGLFLLDSGEYKPLDPGLLARRTGSAGAGAFKAYCLPPGGTPANTLPGPGTYAFFENETSGWRTFRLDERGCAYRMSGSGHGRWKVDYAQRPQVDSKDLAPGKTISLIKLEAGRYFIANWRNGFFNKAELDGENGYGGFYLQVNGG